MSCAGATRVITASNTANTKAARSPRSTAGCDSSRCSVVRALTASGRTPAPSVQRRVTDFTSTYRPSSAGINSPPSIPPKVWPLAATQRRRETVRENGRLAMPPGQHQWPATNKYKPFLPLFPVNPRSRPTCALGCHGGTATPPIRLSGSR